MKRLIFLFAKLYPDWWRERYGLEFDALIEDDADAASFKSAWNVLTGALLMQLQTFTKRRPFPIDSFGAMGLLGVSAMAQLAVATIYVVMGRSLDAITYHSWRQTLTLLGYLELTAGITTTAVGALGSRSHRSWLLILNGLALTGLGVIPIALMRHPISLKTLAFLIILMAISTAILAFRFAQNGPAAAVIETASFGFVAVFLALSFHWIQIAPGSHIDFFWFGAYFGFSALCMLGFALQIRARLFGKQAA